MNLRTKQKKFVLWLLILNTGFLLVLAFTNPTIQAIGIALGTEIVQVILLLRDRDPFELPKKTSRQAPYSNGFLAYALIFGLTGLGLAVASFVWSSHSTGVQMVIGVTVGLACLFLAYGGLWGWWVMYSSRRSGH
jgi:hypothetical protein